MENTLTLNKHRVYYANRTGQTRTGFWGGFNCWGATLFTLGARRKLEWVECREMENWLMENTRPIHRPRKQGDILVVERYDLEHTAVYIGDGKYFHKRGPNTAEITDLAGVRRIYKGRYSWRRVAA